MGCINWDRLVCLHIHEWVSVLWFCFHLLSKLGQTYWQACWMGRRRRKGAFLTYLSSDARHPPQTSQSAAASRWSSHDQLAHPLAVVQQQAKAKTSFLLPSGSKTQVRVCWTFVWNENSAYFPFFPMLRDLWAFPLSDRQNERRRWWLPLPPELPAPS